MPVTQSTLTSLRTDTPALRARHVSVRLGGRAVVDDVNLTLHAGEMVVVVGPNGAGKTTLLRALAGIVPALGDVELEGAPLSSRSRRALARQLAYLPQETYSEFGVSVEDVVRLGRFAYTGAFGALTASDRAAVQRAMHRADIAHLARRPITELSGGERRRVFIARAIAQEARVLVFDEPTAALDIGHACAVMEMLSSLAAGGAAVLVTLHDVVLATRGTQRAILMHEGHILADGPPAEVLTGEAARSAFGVRLVSLEWPNVVVPS